MPILQRLTRAFQTLSTIELDDQSRVGALGEFYAERVLRDEQGLCLPNPIIPHPTKPGLFIESDFLIYTQGNLFCVEIKNYKGSISYPVRPGLGIDETRILQQKIGNYGEGIFTKEHPNPLKKTKYFIHHLKNYLCQLDARCRQFYILPVVGFSDVTDIRAVYDFEVGMISTAHIPAFFEHHRRPSRPLQPPAWLSQVFARVPTWDRLLTARGEWVNGILLDQELTFRDTERALRRFPYQSIQSVVLQRAGGLFSAYDHLTMIDTQGASTAWKSVKGELHLRRFGNEVQTHQLRNLSQILVGVANKRR